MSSIQSILKWVREEKWAFVAYTGLRGTNTSRWYRVRPGLWSYCRYLLEAYGAAGVEGSKSEDSLQFRAGLGAKVPHHEYVEGYTAFANANLRVGPKVGKAYSLEAAVETFLRKKREGPLQAAPLKSSEWLRTNMFVYLVRKPMAYGGRPFVPLEESADYNEAMQNDDEEWRAAHMAMLAKRSRFHKHSSDSELVVERYGTDGHSCDRRFVKPEDEYSCNLCGRKGHHFERSCFLLQESTRVIKTLEEHVLPFGVNKFVEHVEQQ